MATITKWPLNAKEYLMAIVTKSATRLTVDNITVINETATRTSTGNNKFSSTVSVTTSETQVVIPTDIGTNHEMWVVNRDSTNFVTAGFVVEATTAHPIKLLPGQVGVFPGAQALYLKADTAACDVDVCAVED